MPRPAVRLISIISVQSFQRTFFALTKAQVALTEFRFGNEKFSSDILVNVLPTNPRTFRLPFYDKYSFEPPASLVNFVSNAINLEDITLVANSSYRYQDSASVLQAISGHEKLRRLNFIGQWDVGEVGMQEFVAKHAQSLRRLEFDSRALGGEWRYLLEAISRTSKGQLELVSLRHVEEVDDDERESHLAKPTDFDFKWCTYHWECETHDGVFESGR
jgi:hypothetical protein